METTINKSLNSRQKKKGVWHAVKVRWQLYLFLFFPVAFILIFAYYPMFGVQIAFKDFIAAKGIWGSDWVGFKHFRRFFTNYMFTRVLKNTLRLSIYGLVTSFPLAIIFALLINSVKNLQVKKVIQTVTYIPHFISVVVLVGMIHQILNPVMGLYGTFYGLLHDGGYPQDILGKASAFPHIYVWSGIWQGLGWSTIIYIAALSAVDAELHEAAQIDGASRLKRIIYIDFPSILPTASIMLILNIGGIMNVGFEKTYLMQNSLNMINSEVIATYVYKIGMTAGANNFSYASAIGLFNSLVNCAMLVLFNTLSSRLSDDGGGSLW